MSKHILDKLFGSRIRVKILKFMFRNCSGVFNAYELAKKIQEPLDQTRKELTFLSKLGLINKKR